MSGQDFVELFPFIEVYIGSKSPANALALEAELKKRFHDSQLPIVWSLIEVIMSKNDAADRATNQIEAYKDAISRIGSPVINNNVSQAGSQNLAQIGDGNRQSSSAGGSPPWAITRPAIASVILLAAIVIAIWGFAIGHLTPDQRDILCWCLSLASGTSLALFAGTASVKFRGFLPGVSIAATGAIAVWLISSFLLFPPSSSAILNIVPGGSEGEPAREPALEIP